MTTKAGRIRDLTKLQRHIIASMTGGGWMSRPQINSAIGRPTLTMAGNDLRALNELLAVGLVEARPLRNTPINDVLEYRVIEDNSNE